MIARLSLVLVLALTFSVVEADQAQAQCGVQGGLYNYGFGGYGFDVGRLYGVLAKNVPYYAAFPPVYYSAPVPRTYGYSPFAYPPGTATPDIELPTVGAKEIINPYVPASSQPSAEGTKASDNNVTQRVKQIAPLAITNPYVNDESPVLQGPVLTAATVNR